MTTAQAIGLTSKQVTAITGISYRQLDYWTTTKFITASLCDEGGSGNFREFSKEDVLHILVINKLIEGGFHVPRLREITKKLRKMMDDASYHDYLVIQNNDVLRIGWPDVLTQIANEDQLVTVVPLNKLKEQMYKGVFGE